MEKKSMLQIAINHSILLIQKYRWFRYGLVLNIFRLSINDAPSNWRKTQVEHNKAKRYESLMHNSIVWPHPFSMYDIDAIYITICNQIFILIEIIGWFSYFPFWLNSNLIVCIVFTDKHILNQALHDVHFFRYYPQVG